MNLLLLFFFLFFLLSFTVILPLGNFGYLISAPHCEVYKVAGGALISRSSESAGDTKQINTNHSANSSLRFRWGGKQEGKSTIVFLIVLLARNTTPHISKLLSSSGPRFESISLSLSRTTEFNGSAKKRELSIHLLRHITRARQSCGTRFELVGLLMDDPILSEREVPSLFVYSPSLFCKKRERKGERGCVTMSR